MSLLSHQPLLTRKRKASLPPEQRALLLENGSTIVQRNWLYTPACQSTLLPNAYFMSSHEKQAIHKMLLRNCYLKRARICDNLIHLVLDYYKPELVEGVFLDVFDECRRWRLAYVAAIRDEYIAVHYQDFDCRYDDWIHMNSYRLAPVHTYTQPHSVYWRMLNYNNARKYFPPHESPLQQQVRKQLVEQVENSVFVPCFVVLHVVNQILKQSESKLETIPLSNLVTEMNAFIIDFQTNRSHPHQKVLDFTSNPSNFMVPGNHTTREALERSSQLYRFSTS